MSDENPNVADTPAEAPRENDPDAEDSVAAAAREHGVDPEELISEDEATVPRNADGSLKPEPVHVDRLGGKIVVEAIEPDEHDQIVAPFLTDTNKDTITNGEIADLLDAHLVYPDLTTRPGCPDDRITAEFVGSHLSQDQQFGYLEAMCEVGRQYDSAMRLRGEMGDTEKELALKILESDKSVDELTDQGNRPGRRRR